MLGYISWPVERLGHWPQWPQRGLLADPALCDLNVNKKPMNSLKVWANLPAGELFLPEELETRL